MQTRKNRRPDRIWFCAQKEYGYRNGQLLITATAGSADWGPPPSYTPPATLVAGLEIKLEHLTELRAAVNQLRQHAGLPNFNFTVDPNPVRNETTVKADHIRQLRTALEEARTQLGLPVGDYEHPTLTENQSWIYAIDFQEIRSQIASAWNSNTGVDIRWVVADQLGTPRLIFDQSGSLASVSRHDYLPFGEELIAGIGGRTTGQGYSAGPYALDGARQKFTSYERDAETGLDFAQARYFASSQGRFTSPDPLAASAQVTDPQSWNRYSYVGNNPLAFSDPSGMSAQPGGRNISNWNGAMASESASDGISPWPDAAEAITDFEHPAPDSGQGEEPHSTSQPDPQNPTQTPTPPPPCSAQDFNFNNGSGNYTAGELSAIAQTAVGEASTAFFANEVEAVIGTIVNRQNLNIAAYPQRGPFSRGEAIIETPGNLRGGVLGEYDGHRFGSGTTKLDGAKVNGVLPASSYVCRQLMAAKDFAVRAGNMSPADMKALYPYTSNRGIGARLPAGATGVKTIGNTRFFVDAAVRWPF